MFSIILYLTLAYWVLSILFLKKTRHYYFQRFLFLVTIQSLCIASIIESHSILLVNALYLKFFWLLIIFLYLLVYIFQLAISLNKTFPNISTTEWWEAFHIYNWSNFCRTVSDKKPSLITNSEWLVNQKNNHLNLLVQRMSIVMLFLKCLLYLLYTYLLYTSWVLDLEYIWFRVDYFVYTYFLFLPVFIFIFLLLISLVFKKIKWHNIILSYTFSVESRVIDRADFDANFGFMLSLEDLTEYQLYYNHIMYCKSDLSNKKPLYGIHDLNLDNTSNFSRLIWNDMWWDCNIYYFSPLYIDSLYNKYKNKK